MNNFLAPANSGGRTVRPLVLLPGTLCDARVFKPVLSLLPPYEWICPSLDGSENPAALAASLLANLPRQFALAGFSLGGIVALEMIAQAPERIERLALIATTARPDPKSNAHTRRAAVAAARTLGVRRQTLETLFPKYVAVEARGRADLRELIAAMALDGGVETFRVQSELAINRVDSRPRLRAISAPTLVMAGERDRLCPIDRHQEMAALIPGARLEIISGAGHFLLLEKPYAAAERLASWLAAPVPTAPVLASLSGNRNLIDERRA